MLHSLFSIAGVFSWRISARLSRCSPRIDVRVVHLHERCGIYCGECDQYAIPHWIQVPFQPWREVFRYCHRLQPSICEFQLAPYLRLLGKQNSFGCQHAAHIFHCRVPYFCFDSNPFHFVGENLSRLRNLFVCFLLLEVCGHKINALLSRFSAQHQAYLTLSLMCRLAVFYSYWSWLTLLALTTFSRY